MGYAVYHMEKGGKTSGGMGNHIDRIKGKEHTFRHADPNRSHLNQNIQVPKDRHKMNLSEAINDRIKEGYNGKRKIRNDAVKYTMHILSGSHKDMMEIKDNPDLFKDWVKQNYNFIAKEFGEENMVRFSLHLDEKTPHIHAVTVPITDDGRLSAKEVIGNSKKMEERQDRYAEAMEKYGLERGMKKTGVKHENQHQYYKRLQKAYDKTEGIEDLTKKIKVFGVGLRVDKDKTIEQLQSALRASKAALFMENEKREKAEQFKIISAKRYENRENIKRAFRFSLTNEKFREEVIQEQKKSIIKEINSYRFEGYGSTQKEREHKFLVKLKTYMESKGLEEEMLVRVMKENKKEFDKAFNKYTIHPHERNSERKINKGRSM